ncbi:MAG TPA: hypothetical protein VGU01_04345, partial [Sphingomicrobium sp.]|nr:hypothetical protein [Sphingomicrobium sp.]
VRFHALAAIADIETAVRRLVVPGVKRMRFHLPKPLHGWREFIREVGILVIGVLTALSAEQMVETLRWRREVQQACRALRQEIANNDPPRASTPVLPARRMVASAS